MKPAVLCISLAAVMAHSNAQAEPGIYTLSMQDVPAKDLQFINREIVDTKDMEGLHREIALAYPQILGYVTIENEHGELLSYSRGNSGGESGLADLRSIGIGGHTDIEDAYLDRGHIGLKGTLEVATSRELQEEIGLLRDVELGDEVPILTAFDHATSAVHVGVWIHLKVQKAQVTATEEINDAQWLTKDELHKNVAQYEPWSQLIIKQVM